MKFIIYAFLAIITTSQTLEARDKLMAGDIILLPIDCYACKAIEKETGSPYAHSGLVVFENGYPIILEAWSKVEKTPLKDFIKRAKKGVSIKYIRSKEISKRYNSEHSRKELNQFILNFFEENYENLSYDNEYLWDNLDENGNEVLYCSEMITKLLNHVLKVKMPTYKMTYDIARDFWIKYFKGKIPQGKPGNNPGSFLKSGLFYTLDI